MSRKLTTPQLIKKADRLFSKVVRLSEADANGMCQCVSCGRSYHWKKLHAGHYAARTFGATRFDQENTHSQCVFCNTFSSGNPAGYASYIKNKYGSNKIDELWQKAKQPFKWDREELLKLIERLKSEVMHLQKKKGLY